MAVSWDYIKNSELINEKKRIFIKLTITMHCGFCKRQSRLNNKKKINFFALRLYHAEWLWLNKGRWNVGAHQAESKSSRTLKVQTIFHLYNSKRCTNYKQRRWHNTIPFREGKFKLNNVGQFKLNRVSVWIETAVNVTEIHLQMTL